MPNEYSDNQNKTVQKDIAHPSWRELNGIYKSASDSPEHKENCSYYKKPGSRRKTCGLFQIRNQRRISRAQKTEDGRITECEPDDIADTEDIDFFHSKLLNQN